MNVINEPETTKTIIQPSQGWKIVDLKELIRSRELIFFMTWRDLKVRYKQTVLGVAWAIIQPVMTMVVFSIFFGGLARVPSDGIPYPLFSLAGLLPWQLFENSLRNASRSLVTNRNMITKIYFPRVVLPLSSVLACIVDFFVAVPILIFMMIYYHYSPNIYLLLIPFYILLTIITSLGVALWFSAMDVLYRDIGYIIPFICQLWMYLTPIAYGSGMISNPKLQFIYNLNPMVGVVNGFRSSLLGVYNTVPIQSIVFSSVISILILISGLVYFRRMEKQFADLI
ncbi:ABC transporter permease [Flexilinea flocculi]|uniref:Transport permease protein n=1 Tax=Flexilinea flocculi TaxID=1678840 RepID=A0A0S7BXR6_9CHLR|nr:ABC transporter permease [Flexilinea flocculi]GAP41798.1 ABC-type polysaccharide/polyol phosphate export permease [Flexilinea flocculi]